MNIFIKEMRTYRKSIIIWCVGMILMIISGMAKFTAYTTANNSMNDIMAKMPKSIKIIFGVGNFDLSKPKEYFGMLFLYLVLIATIHACMLGANIISKEERDKTTEFLFVKPVSRNKVITSKLCAATANVLILNIVTFICSIALVGKYAKGEAVIGIITILMLGMLILQLMFMLIGTSVAASCKNSKTATGIATGILMSMYLVSVIIDFNDKLINLKYITPFKYFEAKNLIKDNGFQLSFLGLSIIILGVLFISTYRGYRKRDLNI